MPTLETSWEMDFSHDHNELDELLNPADQQDDFTRWLADMYGRTFFGAKRLPDGSYALMARLAYTTGIHMGVDTTGYNRRFCYDNLAECFHAWEKLQTCADEPTGWIARRPE